MLLAHISDLHAGENPKRIEELWDMARAIVRSKAEVCVVTGDIAHHARPEEYHSALGPLNYIQTHMPVEVVPGNHDGGWNGTWGTAKAYAEYHRFVYRLTLEQRGAGDYPIVLDREGYRFIGLDSVHDVFLRPWSIARGRIGSGQLQRLKAALDTKLPCVVYVHHHPFYRGLGLELVDAGELLATMAGSYLFLLFGHKHEAWDQGRMLAADKTPTSRRFRLVNLKSGSWNWVGF